MTLLFRGKTKCPLCGNVITDSDAVVAFPAFLGPNHALSSFSDGVFHERCFLKCPERHEVERLYDHYRSIWDSRPKDLKSAAEIEAWGKKAFKDFG